MKIKNSILKSLLIKLLSKLEKLSMKLKKYKKRGKILNKKESKLVSSIVKDYNKIAIRSLDQLDFYYDDCNGNISKIDLDKIIFNIKEEIKNTKEYTKKMSNKIIDEYTDGKKFIIDNKIKNVYFKAKKLIVTINGMLIRANEEYRKVVDKFLQIRQTILDHSCQVLEENKFLLKFVLDNNIDTDEKFDECAEILTKMYISEKDNELYTKIYKFTNLFNERITENTIIL